MKSFLLVAFLLSLQSVDSSKNTNFVTGRTSFVQLFEWKWTDIAEECELFLGPYGFGGVQVSPPNEHAILWEPDHNKVVRRPWYERYQPVSYNIISRSGDERQFKDMVKRCNAAGVRIYVDAVINHMTGHIGEGNGIGGSYFKPHEMRYDGVPYSSLDFNHYPKCGTGSGDIENYYDTNQVRNCKLSGLNDLDHSKDYVRSKIADYLNHLIDMGVAGFRIDAAKHMWPGDLENIFSRLKDLPQPAFTQGSKPFIFQEVIDLGSEPVKSSQYTHLGRVTEFKYAFNLANVIRKLDGQQLKHLRHFGESWSFVHSDDAVVFLDNHDNQRGHGAGGSNILTFWDSRLYKMAQAFSLAWPYGIHKIMSSYAWPRYFDQHGKDVNNWVGPPHAEDYQTLNVTRNPDLSCGNGWICEHRWRQIFNMVRFSNVVEFDHLSNWWDNHKDQIAFSRGNRGFFALNNEDQPLDIWLQTGLSGGRYCDVISGDNVKNKCTGRYVDVDGYGYAQIFVDNTWEDPMIAIHVESKIVPSRSAIWQQLRKNGENYIYKSTSTNKEKENLVRMQNEV